ncbi:hypothetical protein PSHT_06856 [Puccinia striiformis]|uniref:Uncharacterized protein n=1 Tax=Puccinia striiformis TaxID=27350 RepID=A0A2S4W2M1_9BASI|nr:hypothetical protein PSHT_06856 [Puccinia striiformis]
MPTLSRSYERAFKHNPSLTLAITNGCLKCFGDLLAQFLPAFSSGQPFVLDVHRSLRFFLFGFLHGPCVGKWHESEGYHYEQVESRSAPTNTLSELLLPCLRYDPSHDLKSKSKKSYNTGGFRLFGLLNVSCSINWSCMAPLYTFRWFEGLTIQRYAKDYTNYIAFMPLQYRVPWQGSCGVLWTVFLSLSTHSKTTSTTHFNSITTSSTTPSLIATAFSKLFQSHFNSSTSSSSENSPASIDSDTINNSSTTDFSSQIKRKNNRVIG